MKLPMIMMGLLAASSICRADPVTDTFYENSTGTPLLSLLQNAATSIDIETYEMDDPQVFAAIKAAVDRKVVVRVVEEGAPVGASCKIFTAATSKDSASCTTQKNLVSYVQKGGGQYVAFNHANLCGIPGKTCYEHGKMFIVDHAQAFISTGNFNSTNLCDLSADPSTCNRDYSIVSSDPAVVNALETFFGNDLVGNSYDVSAVLASASTQKLTVSPFSLSPLVAFIQSATTKIQIENQYLEDPDMNAAISQMAEKGIDVEVMTASACAFGTPAASDAKSWTAIYSAFDTAGVKSRMFTSAMKVNGVAGYLHAKTIVIDGTRAWVGSVNGSATSLNNNREYGIFLNDLTQVQKLQVIMSQDFVDANSESWQDSLNCKNDPSSSSQPASEL